MYYRRLPDWIYHLDTTEKLIAYLEFCGREDLINKFKTEGRLYLYELLNAFEPEQWIEDWNYDSVNLRDNVNFIDFGIGGEP